MPIRFSIFFLEFVFLIITVFPSVAQSSSRQADSLKARDLFNTAIDLGMNNEPEKAIELLIQSIALREKIYGNSHLRLTGPYVNMASQYIVLHQLDSAYKYYSIAEQIYLKTIPEDDIRLGIIYTNLGNYYRSNGNIIEAIRYNERAVAIYEKSPDKNQIENYLSTVFNLALSYWGVDREEEALSLSLKFQDKGSFDIKIRFKSLIAKIYKYYKEFDKANSYYKGIINDMIKEYGTEDMKLADVYSSYADYFTKISKEDSSFYYLKKAELIYYKYKNNQAELGNVYKAMADAYSEKKISSSNFADFQTEKLHNLTNAVKYYRESLEIYNPSLKGSRLEYTIIKDGPFPSSTLRILGNLGDSYRQMANLKDTTNKSEKITCLTRAMECLSTGSDLIKYLRTGFISEESKLTFSELQQTIFRLAIDTAYELYRLTGNIRWAEIAFNNSERNKATSLFDKITEIQSRSSSLIPDSLLQLESKYNNTLAYYREKLFDQFRKTKPDSVIITDLKARIFNYEQKNNQLRENLEKNFPDYYQMKYEIKPLTFGEIQKRLKRDEVLLVYSLNSSENENINSIFIFAVSKFSYSFSKQSFSAHYSDQVKTFHDILSDPDFLTIDNQKFSDYCKSAHDLYLVLIAPYNNIIRDKRITIIPDGILNYVPFEALLTRNVSTSAIHFHDLPYFILNNAINYTYSAELLRNKAKKSIIFGNQAVAFSPVYPEISIINNDSIHLSAIPGIYEEVKYLEHKVRTKSYTGTNATERKFRQVAGNYGILHLAMHTLINDSVPLFSRLAFFPEQPDSVENDGWLTLSDIYNLHLKAGMTVLSACHTGSGELRKGEGIMSLARGFLYAGCTSVIMSLWEVEDKTGKQIMNDFYKNLKFGKRKDSALRNAKIKYLSEADPLHSHPHIWLSFIVIGNPDPLFPGARIYLVPAMIIILVILSFELFYRKWRRKSNQQK